MAERVPKQGDVLIVVACCAKGPVAVLATRRAEWRCGGCRKAGVDVREVVLGANGALPEDEASGVAA
jgi:hypothetical protein